MGYEFGALLSDLSKAFDCINHPLLIAKLYNYGVSPLSINMIFSYLKNRTYQTKINEYFSERSRIREHGSITIGIAFMKTSSFFLGGGTSFCSDVILENQHQENQSFETVVIIDLRLIRLHCQIISLAFPAFCEKIDFPTFPAQFPKMVPFAASLVISAFPAWPETLL